MTVIFDPSEQVIFGRINFHGFIHMGKSLPVVTCHLKTIGYFSVNIRFHQHIAVYSELFACIKHRCVMSGSISIFMPVEIAVAEVLFLRHNH